MEWLVFLEPDPLGLLFKTHFRNKYVMLDITHVVADALVECTYKTARTFAKGPTKALGMAKKAVYEGLNMGLEQGLRVMCRMQGELMKSKDYQEGVAAFIEKRKPHFIGE